MDFNIAGIAGTAKDITDKVVSEVNENAPKMAEDAINAVKNSSNDIADQAVSVAEKLTKQDINGDGEIG